MDIVARLLDAAPLPQVLIGPDERVSALNAAARLLFGQNMVRRHYVAVLRQPALLDAVEAALREHKSCRTNYFAREAQRDATWTAAINPVELSTGHGVLITMEDRTATEEAGQIRRDFVANVSHELRTPLTAMMGFIETLRGAARNDPEAHERFLLMMEKEAARMNRLVHDLLSLSRVESEERVRPTSRVDLAGVLASVVSALKNIADDHDVDVVWDGSATSVVIPGDSDQLFQVFSNLLENAMKYGGAGNKITIVVSTNERDPVLRGPAVRVSVNDEGPGIEPLHIPRLTERFYRVDTHRSRELGGTGLGLAIVKHIVSRHRGRLRIESVRGVGSSFTVVLPLKISESASPEV